MEKYLINKILYKKKIDDNYIFKSKKSLYKKIKI